MRMRADWERNFKMLIDSPSKVWEVKEICVWIGCRSTAVVTSEAAAIILSLSRSSVCCRFAALFLSAIQIGLTFFRLCGNYKSFSRIHLTA